jgi:hypothetical protein
LKKRLNAFDDIVTKEAPITHPVILLMDNINMYRGHHRHHRLFKVLGQTMWNFTVRGAIIPNCNGIEHLLSDPTMFEQPQRDLTTLKAEELFIGMLYCTI